MLVAVVMSVAAIVISVVSSTTRAEDIAGQVAPEVARQVVADARAQRVVNARSVLAAGNRELRAKGLPEVADPGPQANAEQLIAAANLAQVLALLPPSITDPLRDNPGRGDLLVIPTGSGIVVGPGSAESGPGGSTSRSTDPRPGGPSGRGSPDRPGGGQRGGSPGDPGGPTAGPPPPSSGPVVPPSRRRLIPPLVPFPGLPLIGT